MAKKIIRRKVKRAITMTAEQKAAIESFNEPLKNVYLQLREKIQQIAKNTVYAFYEIGIMVADVSNNERKYGEAVIPSLAAALGGEWTQERLWYARNFVNTYSKEQVSRLVQLTGGTITFTHFRHLCSLDGTKAATQRKALEQRIIKERLTTRQLEQAMKELLQGRKRSQGGRGPVPPRTPAAGLHEISKYRTEIDKRVNNWDKAVFAKIAEAAPDTITVDTLTQLKETKANVEALIATETKVVGKLDKAIERVERVIEKAKSKRPTATDEEAPRTIRRVKKIRKVKKVAANGSVASKIATAKKRARPSAA